MKTVHLIQHTHWDREWYFTENDSQVLLYYFMADLLNRLEADESLGPFILDGQTVVLEDYFQFAPENRERIQALVANGRLLIGPWYTQTDFLVVGAESITRNLLLGQADCDAFGPRMAVGYVPDSFGQSAQLPMFLTQFAIDKAVVWRGWSEYDTPYTEFLWRSQDGSTVTTSVLPQGYGFAKWLPTDASQAWPRLATLLKKQAVFSRSSQLLLPNGNDQSPFEYGVPDMLDELNTWQTEYRFERSDFTRYFEALAGTPLETFEGELLSPKYMRVHRGIFSTRTDIKQANARLEDFVSRQLEPLLSVNWMLGLPYPQSVVENIWREAMKSHAHDSIGGCNSDRVNAVVKARLLAGQEKANQLYELNMQMLAKGITARQDGKKIIIFNALPGEREGLVALTLYLPGETFRIVDEQGQACRWQILQETSQDMSVIVQELSNSSEPVFYRKCDILLEVSALPASGYTTLYLQEQGSPGFSASSATLPVLENQWLRLTLEDGRVVLLDKRSGKQWNNVIQLVDGGDAGDTYNYSPPEDDWRVNGVLRSAEWQQGSLAGTLTMDWSMTAPRTLTDRNNRLCNAQLDVSMVITITHQSPVLDIKVSVNNTLEDHRLQLEILAEVLTDVHFADQPFGLIQRDNRPATLEVWQQEQWNEAPTSLWPMQSLVMMHDGQQGMGIVTDGLREYEIPAERPSTIAITLLRSVGWLGRAGMPWRPGRASGMALPSPESQIPGEFHTRLALIPLHAGENADFWQQVEQWRTPIAGWLDSGWARFKTNPHQRQFPSSYSLLRWDTPLHFSTLKKAQSEEALILRGWNPGSQPQTSPVPEMEATIREVTLAERPVAESQSSVAVCAPVSWHITPPARG